MWIRYTCNACGQVQLLLRSAANWVSEHSRPSDPGVNWAVCTEMIVPVGHVSPSDCVSQPTLWYVLRVPVNSAEKITKTQTQEINILAMVIGQIYNNCFYSTSSLVFKTGSENRLSEKDRNRIQKQKTRNIFWTLVLL